MRQAITTRYAGPTNFRGSRVIVRADPGRMIVPWDHALGVEDNHKAAAKAYASKYGWTGHWYGGGTNEGYAFVLGCMASSAFTVCNEPR